MRIKTAAAALMTALSVMLMGATISRETRTIRSHPLHGKTVLIDAGHGGIDAGTIGWVTGVREDELNLAVAKYLESFLSKAGATVVMTRSDDGGLYDADTRSDRQKREDMTRRAQMIRDGGEDYVISIHMNGFTESDAYGAQVLYQTGSAEGMALAQTIQEELRGGLDVTNRRQASAGDYMVLRSASVPAVLVECGFLSNAAEEKKLMTPAYQERIAWLIYTGLMRYAAGRQNV